LHGVFFLIHELVSNIALIVTFTFLTSLIHKHQTFTQSSPLKVKTLLGILNGFYGIVLMLYAVPVTSTIIMDLRHLFIILAAQFGGIFSSLIAALIISIGRFVISGGYSFPALVGSIGCIVIAVGCGMISRNAQNVTRKWIYMTLYSVSVFTIVFFLVIKDKQILSVLYAAYWSASIIAASILAFLVDYLRKSNEHFKLMETQAKTDFLTGLNNSREFDAIYSEYVREARHKGENLSLLMLDIDFFKKINDTYGHSSGDAVLKQFGNILVKTSRRFDVVSRNGGEEFSVLLPDTPITKASQVAERIRKSVEEEDFHLPDGGKIKITVSIGVSCFTDTVSIAEDLLEQADQALYKAKQTGRNRICFVTE